MLKIGKTLATFPYSMIIVSDGSYNRDDPGMLAGAKIPRHFMAPVENQVFAQAKRQCDNKTAAVFFSESSYDSKDLDGNPHTFYGNLTIAGFYDSNTTIVECLINRVITESDPDSIKRYAGWVAPAKPSLPKNVVQGSKIVLAAIRYALQHDCCINVNHSEYGSAVAFVRSGELDPCAVYDPDSDSFMDESKLHAINVKRQQRREAFERSQADRRSRY